MSEQVQLVLLLLAEMLILAVIAAPFALIPAFLAKQKGRSFTLWFIYGLFAFFYAFVCFDVWWQMGKDSYLLLGLGVLLAIAPVLHALQAKSAIPDKAADHDLMFGQLVESNAQTVGDDRAIYFYDTMGVWATIAFLVVAITGVLLVNQEMSKTSASVMMVATPPPPPAAAPPPPPSAPKPTKVQPDAGYTSVKEVPKEISTKAPPPKPPEAKETFDTKGGVPGGVPGGVVGGVPGGVPGAPPGGGEPPPPPPPAPEKKEEPKPPPPSIIRKSGGVLQGSATRRVEPNYPPLAKTARISGAVVVEVTVDEAGNVISARALSGHPLLKDAAVNAARAWKFTPTRLSDVPVKVIGTITFNFNL